MTDPVPRTRIRAQEKSVFIDNRVIPLSSPRYVAAELSLAIEAIEDRAFKAGQENIRAAMRYLIGVKK